MSEQPKSQKPLLIMLAVSVLPIVASYFIFFTGVGMPENTVNSGQLLTAAKPLQPIVPEANWAEIEQDKRWRLLLPIENSCTETCESNLYTTRQVHIRLDQKSTRLQRIGVAKTPLNPETKSWLEKEHPRLKIIEAETDRADNWYSEIPELENYGRDFYILVDQEGRAMMLYSSEHHGNDVLKDIKRALKYSIDYQS